MSTEPSGMSFINSKQSPCISFTLIINHSFQSHTVRVVRFLLRFAPVQPYYPTPHSTCPTVSCVRRYRLSLLQLAFPPLSLLANYGSSCIECFYTHQIDCLEHSLPR